MQINVTLYLKSMAPWEPHLLDNKAYKNNEGFPVLCARWVQEAFGTVAKKITLHLHTKPHIDAYLISLSNDPAYVRIYKGKDTSSPILERKVVIYTTIENLLVRFPNNTAFLSITPY